MKDLTWNVERGVVAARAARADRGNVAPDLRARLRVRAVAVRAAMEALYLLAHPEGIRGLGSPARRGDPFRNAGLRAHIGSPSLPVTADRAHPGRTA